MRFFQDYLWEKYSHRVFRVPLDLGFGCPDSSANKFSRCYFCDENGARAQHLRKDMPLKEQLARGIKFVRKRYGSQCGLAAYIQAHSGTNAPADIVSAKIKEIFDYEKFDCLIIATRPDLISNSHLEMLSEISRKIELWVELGVQTSNDKTLELINRRHNFNDSADAVCRLNNCGVNVAAHVILGLPGEDIGDFRKTAKDLSKLPFKAVKVHNLLVLKNTVFEDWFKEGKIKTLSEYQYADLLMDFLKILPNNWLIMRVCSDYPPEKIVAPKWTMNKARFIEMIRLRLSGGDISKYTRVKSADGSWTLWAPEYKEHYRSIAGARSESKKKFVFACDISNLLQEKKKLRILEIGLGIAMNLSETLKVIRESGNASTIEYFALEKNLNGIRAGIELQIVDEEFRELFNSLIKYKEVTYEGNLIKVFEGDARKTIQCLTPYFDAVYLDPFSPDKNPELWTYDFLKIIARLMKNDSIMATYSSAFAIRGALLRCGFFVGEGPSIGRKRGGTVVSREPNKIVDPLSGKEIEILKKTTAGLTYRDPFLSDSPEKIKERRKKLCERLWRKGIPKWLH